LNIHYTTQFKKDYKRIKHAKDAIEELQKIIEQLFRSEKLAPEYNDHKLSGIWNKHRECHVKPDLILIYRKTEENLFLERIGSHSELFK